MRRREFITLLGGATAAWPLGARAQQSMRRVAIINVRLETDPQGQSQLKAFRQGFERLGWDDGRNVKIDVRWAGGNAEQMREIVTEVVALKPDVIVASGSPAVAALKRATSTGCFRRDRRTSGARLHHQHGASGRQYHRLQPG
jgi:putative tryptophan/tyrosine transport system substrate-binding protein